MILFVFFVLVGIIKPADAGPATYGACAAACSAGCCVIGLFSAGFLAAVCMAPCLESCAITAVGCFPEQAQFSVLGEQQLVSIGHINTTNHVLTIDANGTQSWTAVTGNTYTSGEHAFVSISVKNTNDDGHTTSIEVTPNHVVVVANHDGTNIRAISAGDVAPGDFMFTSALPFDGPSETMATAVVTNIWTGQREGKWTLLTARGTAVAFPAIDNAGMLLGIYATTICSEYVQTAPTGRSLVDALAEYSSDHKLTSDDTIP